MGMYSKLSGLPFIIGALYQLWFAFAYLISQTVSHSLGTAVFILYSLLVPKFLVPCPHDRLDAERRKVIDVQMCYPYYHLWKHLLFDRKGMMPQTYPSVPFLFMYGTKKNMLFHGPKFEEKIAQHKERGDKCIAIEGGHWFFKYPAKNVTFSAQQIISHFGY